MRRLSNEEKECIARQYMKLNGKPGDSVEQLYTLYIQAHEALNAIENEGTSPKRGGGAPWGF